MHILIKQLTTISSRDKKETFQKFLALYCFREKKFQRSHIISIFFYLFTFLDNSSLGPTLNFLLSLLDWWDWVSDKNYIFLKVIIF